MNTAKTLMSLVTLVSALGFLSACQPSSNKKDEQKLIYEFEYNGCNTGTHSFNTLAEYCDALTDNELNKGCAINMRAQEYVNRCEGKPQNSTPATPQTAKDEIFASILDWSTSESDYTDSSVISGSMIVDSFSNRNAVEYNFAMAKNLSATSADGHCTVQAHFEPAKLNKTLSFTIFIQQSHSQSYSCANIVEGSLRQGTFLDLKNVTMKDRNSKYTLKDVILNIAPKY
ncbi:hypothetical protein ACLSU7_17085 [Bdellovibrio sp. HCB185ZH]|uniref:hypothetical protein n=1 Tax=Bdellovibrio sp. HCB185ZH TaxID=3394235 RepID=UPI0039A7371B